MTDRRFNEAEVAAIFKQATESQQLRQQQLSSGEGMTLAELQEIAREVGLAPELITQAATAVTLPQNRSSRRFLGLPVGVGQTIELERTLSDAEWEKFVVDLRETFDARGVVKQDGSLRQWTNGNLQALLEPTANGQRVRLRTFKRDALAMMTGGVGMLAITAATAIAAVVGGAPHGNLSIVAELGVIGAGMFSYGAFRLPGWARRRRQQMEQIARRLATGTTSPVLQNPDDVQ